MLSTKGLTRNPLGIIALFVSLIYGFACLVLSTSISNLNSDCERLPLIWFIILFPIIILIAFIFLVVKHHEKLYAPGDFRGDDSFIQTMDKAKSRDKILKDIKELKSAPESQNIVNRFDKAESKVNDSLEQLESNTGLEQSVPIELNEEQLLNIYSNSEKWAIDELSLRYNVIFQRNVQVSTQEGTISLDAFGQSKQCIYIVEIKYWQTKKSDKKLKLSIQDFIMQHSMLEKVYHGKNNFKMIIVLVYDNLKLVNKTEMLEFIQGLYSEASIEFFDYSELKKNYE